MIQTASNHQAPNALVTAGDVPPGPRASGFAARVPLVALLLILAAGAALFAHVGWALILFPYPVDYAEGPLLDQAVRLARLQNIYDNDLTTPPYTVANYPPLYPLLQAPWVRWVGPAFWYGRLLSWSCTVASALLVAAILRALAARWTAAVVAGLTLLTVPYVSYWGALFRIDALALATSLGALFVLVRWPERRWALVGTAILLTAAVYTRQSYGLAAPLAAFVWLVSRKGHRRRAVGLVVLFVVMAGGLLLVLTAATRGGFLFHTVTANVNEYRIERLLAYGKELVLMLPGLLAVGIVFVAVGRRLHATSWRLIAPYFVGAVLAGLTIGKSGSNVNYLLELSAASSLAAGALLAGLWTRPAWRTAVAVLMLVQASLLVGGTRYQQHLQWKLEQRPALEHLLELVHRTEGTVLADEELGLLPLDGRPVHVQPFELTQLARSGEWDPAPFLAELERREFAAVLIYKVPWSAIHRSRWTPEMLERVERGYAATGVVGHTVVYRPKEF
jgi:4-amino-4-deoxy-L-arabinose transferase-like glycosyltransferase